MHAPTDTPAPGSTMPVESAWPSLDALVNRVVETRRRVAAAQAAETRLLAEAAELVADRTALRRQEAQQQGRSLRAWEADLPLREVALELGMALRTSDRGVQRRMSEAYLLTTLFPRTHADWADGEIDAGHVWAITRAGALLRTDADRARFETLALEAARTESPTWMIQAAKAIAATIDPPAFDDAAHRAGDERSVRLFDLDDGMARLIADLPAPIAYAIYDSLTARARAIVDRTDPGTEADADTDTRSDADDSPADADRRTLAQVRADVFGDLLLTAAPSTAATGSGVDSISARIQVTVPALTLAGDPGGGPAILAGYGPIDPTLARRLAGLAPGWDRVFTDPRTGLPVAVDRYRPSAELSRYLAARDERCRAPGCTRPAHGCDRDHTTAAADGGATAPDNLAHLCRRHHTVKHHTAWRVRHLGGGTLEWTGPTGRRYTDRPPSLVRFVPAADDPPPF